MTPHVKYVSICVQREITLNSGKEISAPQIIQGREFTTRDITSFTYQVICWREFTIFLFSVLPHCFFPCLSLWFLFPVSDFFISFLPPWGERNARIYPPVILQRLIFHLPNTYFAVKKGKNTGKSCWGKNMPFIQEGWGKKGLRIRIQAFFSSWIRIKESQICQKLFVIKQNFNKLWGENAKFLLNVQGYK